MIQNPIDEELDESKRKFLCYYTQARNHSLLYGPHNIRHHQMYYKLEKISCEISKIYQAVDELIEKDPKTQRSACRTICTQRYCCDYKAKKVSVIEMLPTAFDIKNHYLNEEVLGREVTKLRVLFKKCKASERKRGCIFLSDTKICQNWTHRPIACRTTWNSYFCYKWGDLSYLENPKKHGEYHIEQLAISNGIHQIKNYPIHIALYYAMKAVNNPTDAIKYLNYANVKNKSKKVLPSITRFDEEDLPNPTYLLF